MNRGKLMVLCKTALLMLLPMAGFSAAPLASPELDKVTHDETLLKALVNHARLVDRYNTVYREKFGKDEEK